MEVKRYRAERIDSRTKSFGLYSIGVFSALILSNFLLIMRLNNDNFLHEFLFIFFILGALFYASINSYLNSKSLPESLSELFLPSAEIGLWWLLVLIMIYQGLAAESSGVLGLRIAGIPISWSYGIIAIVLSVFLEIDSRLVVGIGLLTLALCPFLLIRNSEAVANLTAILAYGFLAWGVLLALVEHFRTVNELES